MQGREVGPHSVPGHSYCLGAGTHFTTLMLYRAKSKAYFRLSESRVTLAGACAQDLEGFPSGGHSWIACRDPRNVACSCSSLRLLSPGSTVLAATSLIDLVNL
eukprot:154894-Rhodomonas_salina.1